MSRTDRAVRRASHHLGVDEALITSALGREVDGRRQQVVLLTDRRVLLVGFRGEAPIALSRDGCAAEYDTVGGVLHIGRGDRQFELRAVPSDVAARLITLLRRHRLTLCQRPENLRHVRLLQD